MVYLTDSLSYIVGTLIILRTFPPSISVKLNVKKMFSGVNLTNIQRKPTDFKRTILVVMPLAWTERDRDSTK